MNYIKCSGLSKKYRKFYALKDVTFKITEPCIIGLVGNNGAGKTTLMSILAGFIKSSEGTAKLFDNIPFDNSLVACNSILVDEKMTYDPFETVDGIVKSYAENCAGFDKNKAFEIMDVFDLPSTRRYRQLSKGMKNQFNIAIGIAANRAVTLMDEPASGLDEGARREFYRILSAEQEKSPRVFMVSTHLLGEFSNVAEKLMVIRRGELVKFGTADEFEVAFIKLEGKREELDEFLGERKVYDRQPFGAVDIVAVENSFSDEDEKRIKELNIVKSSVTASDSCVYLCKTEHEYSRKEARGRRKRGGEEE